VKELRELAHQVYEFFPFLNAGELDHTWLAGRALCHDHVRVVLDDLATMYEYLLEVLHLAECQYGRLPSLLLN
jgi:hypothetical protein